MRTLFCIVNCNAKVARKRPKVLESFKQAIPPHQLKLSHSLEETRQTLEAWKPQKPEILMICGGDGTLNRTLNLLIEVWGTAPLPVILPLPGGTMNVVFKAVSQNKTTASLAISKILAELPAMKPARLTLLKCNHFYGFIFGIGGFADFVKLYLKAKDPSPVWAVYLIVKLAILEMIQKKTGLFASFKASVTINGLLVNANYFKALTSASITHLGFGFHLYPDAKVPGQLGVFLLEKSPLWVLPYFWNFLKNRRALSKKFLQVPARTMYIKTLEPMWCMMDGEIVDLTDQFNITPGPTMDILV